MKEDEKKVEHSQPNMGRENRSDGSWTIPPPPPRASKRRPRVSSSSTPLLPHRQDLSRPRNNNAVSRKGINFKSTRLLFWGDDSSSSEPVNRSHFENESSKDELRPKGWAAFFFGFMYEEPFNDSIDYDENEETITNPSTWNPLNSALFIAYTLTSAAAVTPVLLIPTIGQDFLADDAEASAFTSRAASFAVLGTACGKFLNGPVGDVVGARRTIVVYSALLSLSLIGLAICQSTSSAAWCCFFVEFFLSVQWPCIIVILATHYGPHSHSMYEAGIYVTSIASRLGSLLGIPFLSFFLRQSNWRLVTCLGAWMAMIGSSVAYLFLSDSPTRINEPQNALNPNLLHQMSTVSICTRPAQCLEIAIRVIHSIVATNLIPSLKRVVKSGTFWIVALAHTGSSMVRTSDRIMGSYFHDTSMGQISENRGGELVVYSVLGTVFGLVIAGNMFAQRKERQRKWLVSRLYMITIGSCYFLAILSIPQLRRAIDAPDLVVFFQVAASFAMGFGISVMYYHIPGLVGSAFGNNKGLFSAYTDGVAYGIASIVWQFVGTAVENGSEEGGGWAYGWAAVALLMVLCSILMVEFMEHYFVRASGRQHGTYETILFA
eukprot:scaffold2047_cov129-Cylindrotheca_fusiformis.AAC.26